jgi:peptidoglycan/xylan/chitin deacetylase (PgdA/CDA1 family)
MSLALKIDVCTYAGMRYGVPTLLRLLDRMAVRASFFVTCGPDHSGRAIRRLFRPGFLDKMRRTRAVRTYGLATLLYGTLLPGPHVGRRCAGLMREIVNGGHELAVHGYNHVRWQDRIGVLSRPQILQELRAAWDCVVEATGQTPRAFGAPGWQCTEHSLACEDELGLDYHSDTRGNAPYYPCIGSTSFRTLEIPTTLPTLDETWGAVSDDTALLARWYGRRLQEGLNVYTAHAEMEGRDYEPFLHRFLEIARAEGHSIERLTDVAVRYRSAPRCRVARGTVPGRSGTVAVQGAPCG